MSDTTTAASSTAAPRRVGFIGLGVMGAPMAGHVAGAGFELHAWARSPERARTRLETFAGDAAVTWHDTPAEVARACDVVCTIVGEPGDVSDLYRGDAGLIASAGAGTCLIDLTTSSPTLARELAGEAAEREVLMLDAPVSGGDRGAREGILSVMVGGSDDAFTRGRPVLDTFGKTVVHQGPAGAGQHTKMCNQMAIAPGMLGVCEAIAYATAAGLDPKIVLQSITGGAAGSWSLANLGPRMIDGDFDPGFFVRHFLKDMRIALESAAELGLELPGLKLARERYQALADAGFAEDGTQALMRLYQ